MNYTPTFIVGVIVFIVVIVAIALIYGGDPASTPITPPVITSPNG